LNQLLIFVEVDASIFRCFGLIMVNITTTLEWIGCALGLLGAAMLAFNFQYSRYGWFAFLGANVAMISFALLIDKHGLLVSQIGFACTSVLGIWRSGFLSRFGSAGKVVAGETTALVSGVDANAASESNRSVSVASATGTAMSVSTVTHPRASHMSHRTTVQKHPMATPEPAHLPVTLKDVRGLTEEQFASAAVYLTKTIPKSLALARRVLVDGEIQATVAHDANVSAQQMSVIVANVRKAYLRSSQDAASVGWVTRPVSLPAELWAKVVELEARATRLLRQRNTEVSKALLQQADDQKLKALAEREQTASSVKTSARKPRAMPAWSSCKKPNDVCRG
jgi:hypothetical protein